MIIGNFDYRTPTFYYIGTYELAIETPINTPYISALKQQPCILYTPHTRDCKAFFLM